MTSRNFYLPTDRHVLIAGMTRSGKSFLCEEYLARYRYVVKFDTKHEVDERRKKREGIWSTLVENKDFTVTNHYEELEGIETDKIIYAPSFDEMEDDIYNEFFRWIYERENTILWIDELMSFTTANSYPSELKRLMIMGNSKNIAVWNCTQRPSGIPSIVTANVSYIFCFNLNLPNDRKKLVDITGCQEMLQMPGGHNFWYYGMGDTKAVKAVLVK